MGNAGAKILTVISKGDENESVKTVLSDISSKNKELIYDRSFGDKNGIYDFTLFYSPYH